MMREISCVLGYQCDCCGKTFEFPFEAAEHGLWCVKYMKLRGGNRIAGERQMAAIKLETYKSDGTRSGILLSEPEPVEIVPDLIQMRRSLKNLVGNWS